MIVTKVFPGDSEQIDLDAAASRDRLLELYAAPSRDWLRINLITNVSGSAGGSDGTSETLTNPADRRILGVIRELSDVVLIGAQSLRKEGYLLPKRSKLAILTASGELAGHMIVPPIEAERLFVLCPIAALDRAKETLGVEQAEFIVVPAENGVVAMPDVLAALRSRQLTSIVCEGGPRLAAQLVAAQLVNEACLSTSPLIGGPLLPLLGSDPITQTAVSLRQLMVDDLSGVYARWILEASAR